MFSMRFLGSSQSRGVSCVKLPAAVAFPTDGRLLQRIEESRRALPANNVKPLWKSRELAPSVSRERTVEGPAIIKASLTTVVVPLARTPGSAARGREGVSVSTARS